MRFKKSFTQSCCYNYSRVDDSWCSQRKGKQLLMQKEGSTSCAERLQQLTLPAPTIDGCADVDLLCGRCRPLVPTNVPGLSTHHRPWGCSGSEEQKARKWDDLQSEIHKWRNQRRETQSPVRVLNTKRASLYQYLSKLLVCLFGTSASSYFPQASKHTSCLKFVM